MRSILRIIWAVVWLYLAYLVLRLTAGAISVMVELVRSGVTMAHGLKAAATMGAGLFVLLAFAGLPLVAPFLVRPKPGSTILSGLLGSSDEDDDDDPDEKRREHHEQAQSEDPGDTPEDVDLGSVGDAAAAGAAAMLEGAGGSATGAGYTWNRAKQGWKQVTDPREIPKRQARRWLFGLYNKLARFFR